MQVQDLVSVGDYAASLTSSCGKSNSLDWHLDLIRIVVGSIQARITFGNKARKREGKPFSQYASLQARKGVRVGSDKRSQPVKSGFGDSGERDFPIADSANVPIGGNYRDLTDIGDASTLPTSVHGTQTQSIKKKQIKDLSSIVIKDRRRSKVTDFSPGPAAFLIHSMTKDALFYAFFNNSISYAISLPSEG
ncbi:NH(3)-dependent NAD(+) synthetase [Striga asiatica]|uniref:NH(3)-dependent NAD(+) synthetase n=1 Tax=Striga asiatica TaxID=4170 RepID=A0A5A7QYP3_STRAF|nr:NH(3)-dependent NAD(+) synthetase [Striga asiatica]